MEACASKGRLGPSLQEALAGFAAEDWERALRSEHPQVGAVVLWLLDEERAGAVLRLKSAKDRKDLLARVAAMEQVGEAALALADEACRKWAEERGRTALNPEEADGGPKGKARRLAAAARRGASQAKREAEPMRFVPLEGVAPIEMTAQEEAEALDFVRKAKAWWAAEKIDNESNVRKGV